MLLDSNPSASDDQRETIIDSREHETFLERYEILSLVGEGGFGIVYKARHSLIGRTVAIKFLHEQAPDTVTMRRFQVEAQAAASLTHPNIVTVYDFGAAPDDRLYLIMDFVEGTSLYEAIGDTEHLDVDRAINIFIQTCDALEHAHKRGIIHRDLKPSNIMLADDEYDGDFVKIVDFGLAKVMAAGPEQNEKLTQTGEILGTPLYMSPEQCRGEAPDNRSDIYSLGCIMYRVLTGQQPILGKNALSTVYQHISKEPEPFAAAAPEIEIPRALEQVVFKALQKNPADRYQTMGELAADLRNVRKGRQSRAAWVPSRRAAVWMVAGLLVLLSAAVVLLQSGQTWWGSSRTNVQASQPANGKAGKQQPAKSVARKQATGGTVASRGKVEARKRVPANQVTSRAGADPGKSEVPGYYTPEPAPPRLAPDRFARNTPTDDGSSDRPARNTSTGDRSYDRSAYYADSAASEPTDDYPGSAAPPPSGSQRGRKTTKKARLARTIGNFAEELLSEGGTAGQGLGRKVGRYGKFIKDMVDDH